MHEKMRSPYRWLKTIQIHKDTHKEKGRNRQKVGLGSLKPITMIGFCSNSPFLEANKCQRYPFCPVPPFFNIQMRFSIKYRTKYFLGQNPLLREWIIPPHVP